VIPCIYNIVFIYQMTNGGVFMIQYEKADFEKMYGNITAETIVSAANCVSQCTGCMCNCRCSCSGGVIVDVDWEM